MSRSKGTRPPRAPQSDPAEAGHESGTQGHPADNGSSEEEAETGTTVATEEPAQVQLTIKGSDKSARAAAKRFGEGAAAKIPAAAPAPVNDPEAGGEPSDNDPIATLLADGKNMVIVTRQTPRNIRNPRTGEKIITNVRLPGKYTCPTSISAIEEQVFEEYWGATYKCTIHPDTSSGENTILGHFKIEHPDPKAPPYVEGVTDVEPDQVDPAQERLLSGKDPTMQETDALVEIREQLKRQLERANTRKEIAETQKLIKEINAELDGRDQKPATENDEIRKLRQENERLRQDAEAKKNDDRFSAMQNSIADLTKTVAALINAPAKKSDDNALFVKMLEQSQQHSKDMLALIQSQQNTRHAPSADGDLDKFLDRVTKLQGITGTTPNKGGTGRHSDVESRLIDLAWGQLTGSRGSDEAPEESDPYEDVLKTALKEFAPIAKTFVEKKMNQETAATGGAPIPPEVMNRIYAEAGTAAAKKVQEDLLTQGIKLVADANGKLHALPAPKAAQHVPPRQPTSRVVSTTKTQEGVVKKVVVQPHDLSKKPTPSESAAPAKASVDAPPKGDDVPKHGIFPMLGENGAELQIPFPVRPGEMKYDRKFSVNFILDGIRSEIRQGYPQKAQTDSKAESYVVGDAIEYLDDEILDNILEIDSGMKLEALLAPWGDTAKITEIKSAGEEEVVASYLRKLVMTIQREWQREKDASRS